MAGNPYLGRLAAAGKNPHGKKSERLVAKKMGAKLHRSSGSTRGEKSDASLPTFRLEMKSTSTMVLALDLSWFVKITTEALQSGKTPAIVVSFVDPQGKPRMKSYAEWVLIPRTAFQELIEKPE